MNALGVNLAKVNYVLHLEDGKTVEGTTDGQGKTQRVTTQVPRKIVKAELKAESSPCCALHGDNSGADRDALVIDVGGVITNSAGIGVSIQQVQTPKGKARGLTQGEIAMASLVFGGSVDYAKVKIHNGEYLWFGMQNDDIAMTPNGEMYFNPEHFKEDFSTGGISDQMWFIHEMTHVWQYQLGYPVKFRGAIRLGLSYRYTLAVGKCLRNYNMEAQGNILADYYTVRFRGLPATMYEEQYRQDPYALALLEAVLADFIHDPGDKSNLP